MRAAVYTAATFALLVLAGVTWVEVSVGRDLRHLRGFWLERERRRA